MKSLKQHITESLNSNDIESQLNDWAESSMQQDELEDLWQEAKYEGIGYDIFLDMIKNQRARKRAKSIIG